MSARVAAFFDLDGSLLPLPSLEQRFFRMLRYHGEIPLKNYFLWLRETMKLFPRDITAATHANKMYLQGVQSFDGSDPENRGDSSAHQSGHQDEGQASAPPRRAPRWPVPHFFEEGVEKVECHAMLGHAIVIVSGTLFPLANAAARAMEAELAARGFATKIRVCATSLEETGGSWTGRILGEAMFGEAKARALRALAGEMQFELARCWAYGDSAKDRWMLEAVGRPVVVNPTWKLARIARKRDWPVLRWTEKRHLTQTPREQQENPKRHTEEPMNNSALRQAERRA
ncbi:MAG TPA: haloacid dehalogenase-like hydrolase [Candidatus Acidoferrum sp.]